MTVVKNTSCIMLHSLTVHLVGLTSPAPAVKFKVEPLPSKKFALFSSTKTLGK